MNLKSACILSSLLFLSSLANSAAREGIPTYPAIDTLLDAQVAINDLANKVLPKSGGDDLFFLDRQNIRVITRNHVPLTDSTFSLGSSGIEWLEGYIDKVITSTITASSGTITNLTASSVSISTLTSVSSATITNLSVSTLTVTTKETVTLITVSEALNVTAVSDSTSPATNYFYRDNFPKAWARFDGTSATPSTADDLNFSNTVTKNGTGDYTLTFSRGMSNTNYGVGGTCAAAAGQNFLVPVTMDTVSVRVQCVRSSTEALADSSAVFVFIMGDQ